MTTPVYDPLGEHSLPSVKGLRCGVCHSFAPDHEPGCIIKRQKLQVSRLCHLVRELTDGTNYDPNDLIKGALNV